MKVPHNQRELDNHSLIDLKNSVHVWVTKLSKTPEEYARYLEILDKQERGKYHSYYYNKEKIRYLVSRGCLKNLLANYLRLDPVNVEIKYTRYGKPILNESLNKHGINFSVSHSHEIIVYAITCSREVGVDVEYLDKNINFLNIASLFFTKREIKTLERVPETKKPRIFYYLWTGKEALLKAAGGNHPIDFRDIEISIDSGDDKEITWNNAYAEKEWIIRPLFLPDNYYGVCVTTSNVLEVSMHAFTSACSGNYSWFSRFSE